jgi:hypothetical protein
MPLREAIHIINVEMIAGNKYIATAAGSRAANIIVRDTHRFPGSKSCPHIDLCC